MHWIDPDCLPETKGQVERFLINPRGEIDGLVLNGAKNRATLVHVPPHLCADIEAAIRPGETVGVRGVRPRGTDMIAAVALTAADGTAIVDHGPDRNRRDKPRKNGRGATPVENTKVAGTVRLSLYAPRGELRGALLEDGSIIRTDPKHAAHFAMLLQPGAPVAVRGDGIETPHGRLVEAKEIGRDLDHLKPAKAPKHPK